MHVCCFCVLSVVIISEPRINYSRVGSLLSLNKYGSAKNPKNTAKLAIAI